MRPVRALTLVAGAAAGVRSATAPAAGAATSGQPPAARAALKAAPRVTPAVRAAAGCYRLTARPLGDDGPVPLPAVVRLDTVVQRTEGRRPDFRARPDIATHHDLPFAPGWRLAGRDSLTVDWHDGLSGSTLTLRRAGADWRGVAVYSVDVVPSPTPRASVTAVRVACRP